jgi:hypothetical protein
MRAAMLFVGLIAVAIAGCGGGGGGGSNTSGAPGAVRLGKSQLE